VAGNGEMRRRHGSGSGNSNFCNSRFVVVCFCWVRKRGPESQRRQAAGESAAVVGGARAGDEIKGRKWIRLIIANCDPKMLH
jgi:hypothetical protein